MTNAEMQARNGQTYLCGAAPQVGDVVRSGDLELLVVELGRSDDPVYVGSLELVGVPRDLPPPQGRGKDVWAPWTGSAGACVWLPWRCRLVRRDALKELP